MSDDQVPNIVRHRPDTRTLAQPLSSASIAQILESRPTYHGLNAEPTIEGDDGDDNDCAPSPTMFPLTRARFKHEAAVKKTEDEKDSLQYYAASPIPLRVQTPALPEDLSPIPTPMALSEGDDHRLTEEEAAELDIWVFREGNAPADAEKPPTGKPVVLCDCCREVITPEADGQ